MSQNVKLRIRVLTFLATFFAMGLGLYAGEPGLDKEKARQRLSQVRVPVFFESITDGPSIDRNMDETIKVLKDMRADFIFRGFMQGPTVLETPDDIPPELLEHFAAMNRSRKEVSEFYRSNGYTYKRLQEAIPAVKKQMPDVIFCGGIPSQWINSVERNPLTGKILKGEDTWKMALDPQKWKVEYEGKPLTKEEFQKLFAVTHNWVKQNENYDWRKVMAYYPDLTSPGFQEVILSWAQKQIDCGADAIWIDLLLTQPRLMAQFTKDANHPAVKQSYEAACKVVNDIHSYGLSKGRYVLVGTWAFPLVRFPFPMPDLDFVTMTPQPDEIVQKKLDEAKWDGEVFLTRKRLGKLPVFVFIDCMGDKGVMASFSQSLSKEEQKERIKCLDAFCQSKGLVFAFPVHGGGMGDHAKTLSFGKSHRYDSLAPEFETYDTIKALALSKTAAGAR